MLVSRRFTTTQDDGLGPGVSEPVRRPLARAQRAHDAQAGARAAQPAGGGPRTLAADEHREQTGSAEPGRFALIVRGEAPIK